MANLPPLEGNSTPLFRRRGLKLLDGRKWNETEGSVIFYFGEGIDVSRGV